MGKRREHTQTYIRELEHIFSDGVITPEYQDAQRQVIQDNRKFNKSMLIGNVLTAFSIIKSAYIAAIAAAVAYAAHMPAAVDIAVAPAAAYLSQITELAVAKRIFPAR